MAIQVKETFYDKSKVVSTENPRITGAIQTMIDRGYSKDSIVKITGAPPEVVEHHQRLREKMNQPRSRGDQRSKEDRERDGED